MRCTASGAKPWNVRWVCKLCAMTSPSSNPRIRCWRSTCAAAIPSDAFSEVPYQKGPAVLDLPRVQVRPRTLRCVPARLLRSLCVQEHLHRAVPRVPQGQSARSLSGRRQPRSGHAVGDGPGIPADAVLPASNAFEPVDAGAQRLARRQGRRRRSSTTRDWADAAMAVLPRRHARHAAQGAARRPRSGFRLDAQRQSREVGPQLVHAGDPQRLSAELSRASRNTCRRSGAASSSRLCTRS